MIDNDNELQVEATLLCLVFSSLLKNSEWNPCYNQTLLIASHIYIYMHAAKHWMLLNSNTSMALQLPSMHSLHITQKGVVAARKNGFIRYTVVCTRYL